MSKATRAPWLRFGTRSAPEQADQRRRGVLDVFLLATWCGLAAGLLEVAARVSYRAVVSTGGLYWMSRHFIWLTPLANIFVFCLLGVSLAVIRGLWPRLGGWMSRRLYCALTLLPMLMVAVPQVYSEAWFALTLGIASWLVPWFEHRPSASRRWLVWSFPALSGIVCILALSVLAGDWRKERTEARRAPPPTGSPNVLLIVLDTVRADHLSLYGYHRPTTPTLERLARKGVRFDRARATAPWTLASHASMFTGRLPHELNVKWATPLRTNAPMLAEHFGARGYATAGVAANVYCSYDTGLDRGFTHFEDYVLKNLSFLRTAILVDEFLRAEHMVDARIAASPLAPLREILPWLYAGVQKEARLINSSFLDWLDRRPAGERPFFAFLNYMDAHTPYKLPATAPHRFGRQPQTQDEIEIVYEKWVEIDKLELPRRYLNMARDCYDDCIAYLDSELGSLFEALERRGILDRTLVVITSDHGEGFGEHDLFEHGASLYDTEIRVPLLIIPPGGVPAGAVVSEIVSLCDLPTTLVDLAGVQDGASFPGRSLAGLWRGLPAEVGAAANRGAVSELQEPTPIDPNHGRSPAARGPLISVAQDNYVYIRNQGDGTEELFDERDDPLQLTNRAHAEAFQPVLERLRRRIDAIRPDKSDAYH